MAKTIREIKDEKWARENAGNPVLVSFVNAVNKDHDVDAAHAEALSLAYLPRAIWTPWAEVLCGTCHLGLSGHVAYASFRRIPLSSCLVTRDDAHLGHCDQCGGEVGDEDAAIVGLQNVARAIGAKLEQTGGMCSAAVKTLPNGWTFVVTNMDEGEWCLGAYAPGVWEDVDGHGVEAEWYDTFETPGALVEAALARLADAR